MSRPDLPLVRDLITNVWLCADCVRARAGVPRDLVDETLHALEAAIDDFRKEVRRCDGCLARKVVHRIG